MTQRRRPPSFISKLVDPELAFFWSESGVQLGQHIFPVQGYVTVRKFAAFDETRVEGRTAFMEELGLAPRDRPGQPWLSMLLLAFRRLATSPTSLFRRFCRSLEIFVHPQRPSLRHLLALPLARFYVTRHLRTAEHPAPWLEGAQKRKIDFAKVLHDRVAEILHTALMVDCTFSHRQRKLEHDDARSSSHHVVS